MPSNAAAAFGEEIGKLFEDTVLKGLSGDVEARGCTIRPEKMKNGTGNVYQIDAVVFNKDGNPLVIIDPKYIRYTKHNRDKGSWLCVAHYNLRKTFPIFVTALGKRGIGFDWAENDRSASVQALKSFCELSETQKRQVADDITSGLMPQLRKEVIQVLDTDVSTIPQRVTQVEILLKTDRNEMLLSSFKSVPLAIGYLAGLVADKSDISRPRNT